MRDWNPLYIIGIGFVLLMVGFILPLLMVMKVIESTFFLNFFAYGASFTGLMLGIVGSAWYTGSKRRRNRRY